MEFQRLLRAKALEFENVLNVARSGLDHGTQKGNIVEQKFRDYLGSLLPDRFGITEGIIYSSAGQKSKQLDVIIFDKHRAPLIFNENGTRGIPV